MVGVAQFKARLSEFLDLVRSGDEVVITDRGRPVARISRIEDSSTTLDDLVRAGVVRAPRSRLPADFFTREPPAYDGPALSDAVIEERREGR
mgnify:FL=1